MNQRFENLAEAAMVHVPGSTGLHTRAFSLEKFAELVVQKCMSIAQEYDGAKLGGPGLIIAMRIEQHFGVDS